jgi:hypothetical protein
VPQYLPGPTPHINPEYISAPFEIGVLTMKTICKPKAEAKPHGIYKHNLKFVSILDKAFIRRQKELKRKAKKT